MHKDFLCQPKHSTFFRVSVTLKFSSSLVGPPPPMCFWHPAASIFEAKIPIDWTVGKTSLKSLSRHTGSCQNLFLCQTTWQKLQPKKNGEKKQSHFWATNFKQLQIPAEIRWPHTALKAFLGFELQVQHCPAKFVQNECI